jgi:hypothetical protein
MCIKTFQYSEVVLKNLLRYIHIKAKVTLMLYKILSFSVFCNNRKNNLKFCSKLKERFFSIFKPLLLMTIELILLQFHFVFTANIVRHIIIKIWIETNFVTFSL